ncbi:MAG: hypothetical protein ACI9VR_002509, partial [Cognaticolwellia sp.]
TTQANEIDVDDFVDAVEHPGRREDARVVLEMMRRITGLEPRMWGATLVGFGTYHYKYETGREGDLFRLGFSPRKAKMVVYIMPYTDAFEPLLAKLGPYKMGKSCLYLGRLNKVDLDVLEQIMVLSLKEMAERYPVGA